MQVSAEILAELEGLRELFRADAASYVAEVVEDWTALAPRLDRADPDARSLAASLSAKVHRLAGTAATFGLGELGHAATVLQEHFTTLAETPGDGRLARAPGDELIARLKAAIMAGPELSR
jgi:chemotaxis protein histidine kinase CheA